MTQPINLNKVRKAQAKVKKRLQAHENAIKFGLTKAERVLNATRNEKARAKLDQLRFDDE